MKIYNSIDLILAKGMGNYECLEGVGDRRIYHLFKVKCEICSQEVVRGRAFGNLNNFQKKPGLKMVSFKEE